jgi:Domain of unknown function (DUF5086)
MLRLLVILSLSASVLRAEQPPLRSVKNWEVRGAPGRITWVELHDVDAADPAVIHVEVLSRRKNDDPSEVRHLRAHLAITLDALQRSVVRPLRDKRGVYPESFDAAYKRWQEKAAAGTGEVCRTSLYECVDTKAK